MNDEIVERYRSFVEGVAARTQQQLRLRLSIEELTSYGFIGLMQALGRYDEHTDATATFTSFAYYRVRGAMLDGCRQEGWAPRDRPMAIHDFAAIHDHLESAHRTSLQAPPASSLGESIERVSKTVGQVLTLMLVRDVDLEHIIVAQDTPQERALEEKQRSAMIRRGLEALDDQQRAIIVRHHLEGEPMSSIAREMGMSPSWMSRMHARALDTMRAALEDERAASDAPTTRSTRPQGAPSSHNR